jgi:hypothetical protein
VCWSAYNSGIKLMLEMAVDQMSLKLVTVWKNNSILRVLRDGKCVTVSVLVWNLWIEKLGISICGKSWEFAILRTLRGGKVGVK